MGPHPPQWYSASAVESAYRLIWLQLEVSHGHRFATAFLEDFAPQIFSACEQLCSADTALTSQRHPPHRRPSWS